MVEPVRVNRRKFLLASGGVAAAATSAQFVPATLLAQDKPLPPFASFKSPEAMIVHSANTMETDREVMGAPPITPLNELFVRNNLPAPSEEIVADPDIWSVEFEGVAEPGSMTLGEMKKLGVESVAAVLQCSGNGRAFFDHETSGTQWAVGAAGNVFWTGVPLRRILTAMGGTLQQSGFVTATGGEELPPGIDPLTIMVERSVPVEALENALLAYEMNGEPLKVAHGGPVRFVVPGYFGVNNVKYVRKVALTENESGSKIQQSGYRLRAVGDSGGPSQPSMYKMVVKSWVTEPMRDVSTGQVLVQGVAMGGDSPVSSVEVSVDGGATWNAANLSGPNLGRFAWRPFSYLVNLEAGTHLIASRARNDAGEEQPELFEPNHRGYGHNGWRDHAIELTVS
ncbi:MAG: sulfite oxidase [Pseudomonadota bacterium]